MIIKCPECGKEISDKAKFCIHCGFTLNEAASSVNKNPSDAPETKIEYKELHSNGRIFHYIDDSSKPLCPHCNKPVDWVATMCSNCNKSIMEKSSENFVEKAPQNTVSNACNTYNTYSAYNASREEKDTAFKAYKERQNHEQYSYTQYGQNQSSDKPEGERYASLKAGIFLGIVACTFPASSSVPTCRACSASLDMPLSTGVSFRRSNGT